MGRVCAVFGCNNSDSKNKACKLGLTFHAFPLKRSQALRAWELALKRKIFKATSNSFLCSEHFNQDDFHIVITN